MRAGGRFDGRLPDWAEVQDAHDWKALLLGNGLSINIWGNFEYASLYEEAKQRGLFNERDARLFERLGATSFEQVLHSLAEAIRVGEALDKKRPSERKRYATVQETLAKAVHSVHIERDELPPDTRLRIQRELRLYRNAFTTSYDLILYWSMMCEDGQRGFLDYFWAGRRKDTFDERTYKPSVGTSRTRIHFLHGALHLVEMSNGVTCKRKNRMLNLLEQFGRPYGRDEGAQPLIVTESKPAEKRRRIADNDYLSFCWRVLEECDAPLVVFGHSLSDQDRHLVDALNHHPERPLAVSLHDRGRKVNAREMHRIASLLDTEADLRFFDAATHPLGAPELRLRETAGRRLWRPDPGRAA